MAMATSPEASVKTQWAVPPGALLKLAPRSGPPRLSPLTPVPEPLALDAGRGAGGAVRVAVVDPGVAAHVDGGVGLGDGERQGVADGVVVAAAERPLLAVAAGVGAGQAVAERHPGAAHAADRDG